MLTLVPTPIGNLEDITLRALNILRLCDGILAEDTRTSGKLLRHFEIDKALTAFHAHNEHKALQAVMNRLKTGQHLALISDAGTPGISDPGFLLVRECIQEGVTVETLPGPTAFVPALVNSGLPCDRFVFEGFLPHKKGRQTRIQALEEESRTMVFYESPYRLVKLLAQLSEVLGPDRQACVTRELTKIHEENRRGSLEILIKHYEESGVKGEIVVCVAGKVSK